MSENFTAAWLAASASRIEIIIENLQLTDFKSNNNFPINTGPIIANLLLLRDTHASRRVIRQQSGRCRLPRDIMKITSKLLFSAGIALASMNASAGLTPIYDSFGTLAAADFGVGAGANGAVAIDTFTGKNILGQSTRNTITLGLTVLPGNAQMPAVRNDGHGIFTAAVGADNSSVGSFLDQWAKWDLGYYIGGAVGSNLYLYKMLFDIDPTANENFKTFYLSANSQGTLNVGNIGYEILGAYSFDPRRVGQYSVTLEAVNAVTGSVVGMTSAVVRVSAIPEPASLGLIGLALAGLAAARRRKA